MICITAVCPSLITDTEYVLRTISWMLNHPVDAHPAPFAYIIGLPLQLVDKAGDGRQRQYQFEVHGRAQPNGE